MSIGDVIIGQIVTEKSERLKSAAKRTYTLRVRPSATKIDIINALRSLYDVEVDQVRMLRVPGKTRVVGRGKVMRKRPAYKKAMVTLTSDSKTLDLASFSA